MFALYMMWRNNDNQEATFKIGLVLVAIILISLFKNMGIIIYQMITNSYGKFKNWIHKKTGHHQKKKLRLRKEALKRNQENYKLWRRKEIIKLDNQIGTLSLDDPLRPTLISKIKDLINKPEFEDSQV